MKIARLEVKGEVNDISVSTTLPNQDPVHVFDEELPPSLDATGSEVSFN